MTWPILRLDPPIPVAIELDFFPAEFQPINGSAMAYGWIDSGVDHNLTWICALNDGGAIWCVPNPKVRLVRNITLGRKKRRITLAEYSRQVDKAAHAMKSA